MNLLFPILVFLLTIASLPTPSLAGKILVTYSPGAKSHLGSILPFVNQLAKAGHNVTLSYIYLKEEEGERTFQPNINTIKIHLGEKDQMGRVDEIGKMVWGSTLHSPAFIFFYSQLARAFNTLIDVHPHALTQTIDGDWDFVVVSELFTLHGYAIAHLLHEKKGTPYGIISTSTFLSSDAYHASMGQHWLGKSQMFGFEPPTGNKIAYSPTKFSHRLINVLEHIGELVGMSAVGSLVMPNTLSRLTSLHSFSMPQFIRGSSVAVTDSIEFLGAPVSQVQDLRVVGSHCELPKKGLPEEYRTFVEDPLSKGTVYIAFGTFIPWDYAPPEKVRIIFDALAEFSEYRLIFAFNGRFPNFTIPSHIKLVKWAPQTEILSHPNTKVFLTHGGLKSVKESLCSKTPMLVMAMFAEQSYNSKAVLQFGIGSALNKYTITKQSIVRELREVLENEKYSQRVEKMRDMFLDRIVPAVEDGEFFVSRRIRLDQQGQKGSKLFFQRKGTELGLWEFYYVDAFVMVLALIWAMASSK